jgi:5-methyltetrahydropteroyltriglutamate--homocysteine methyltransferase
VPEPHLQQAWEDATRLAIRAQEDAGLDIITDGEIRRESYSNRFATALDGVDLDNPGTVTQPLRAAEPGAAHHGGAIRRRHAVEVDDLLFLKAHTTRQVKITVPGPFTMSCQAQNDFYADDEAMAMDYARGAERARSATSSPPVPMSCRSTNPGCRRSPRRRASTA